jgi:ribosomal protein S12 methylthiotransferase
MEDILDEVEKLVARGVKEFQIIAQELTFYGEDLYGRQAIAELVDRMAQIPGVRWIRLHYAYPANFPWDLLPVMARHANVCKYLDIALQHISDNILERMKRNVTRQQTLDLIARIRREVPGIHLRTTLLVGFPGETEDDFEELVDFVREMRFERMGAFAYSEEEGTYSALHYEDDVPEELKQSRLDRLMAVQQRISAQVEAEKVGQTLTTIIDRYEGGKGRKGHRQGGYYIGRTEFCSPEVDPEVLIQADEGTLKIGEFYEVLITDSEEFDLYGIIEGKRT